MSEASWLHSLSAYLFWDTPADMLDAELHSGQIIERVVQRGTWNDFQILRNHYSADIICEKLCDARFLDDKTLNFCSLFFEIPKEQFRCYTLKQLHPQYFSY